MKLLPRPRYTLGTRSGWSSGAVGEDFLRSRNLRGNLIVRQLLKVRL